MTINTSREAELLPVIQADRDAAARFIGGETDIVQARTAYEIRQGEHDEWPLVQALAHHRVADREAWVEAGAAAYFQGYGDAWEDAERLPLKYDVTSANDGWQNYRDTFLAALTTRIVSSGVEGEGVGRSGADAPSRAQASPGAAEEASPPSGFRPTNARSK